MTYYNEHDPEAAAWLRGLIRAGEIPAGDVDDRSIVDVSPHDLSGYTQQHFFAGVGGWPLALRLAELADKMKRFAAENYPPDKKGQVDFARVLLEGYAQELTEPEPNVKVSHERNEH